MDLNIQINEQIYENENELLPEAIKIETAKKEYLRIKEFDYQVLNRDNALDKTVDTILEIIHAEHHRTIPRKVNL